MPEGEPMGAALFLSAGTIAAIAAVLIWYFKRKQP